MKREPVIRKRTVTVLTDPKPMFNSIVGSGANGTPLRVIKSEETQQEAVMPKNLKNGTADIAHLAFSGEKFKTEKAVKSWLDAGGYVDYAIQKKDDGSFSVDGNTELKNKHEIEVEDGVTATVGEADGEVADTANADVTSMNGQKTEAPRTGAQKSDDELRAIAEERVRTESDISKEDWDGLKQSTKDFYVNPIIAAMKAEGTADAVAEGTEGTNSEEDAAGEASSAATADVSAEKDETGATSADAPKEDDATAEEGTAKGDAPEKPSEELPSLLIKGEDGLISVVAKKSGYYEVSELAEIILSLSWLKTNFDYDAYAGHLSPEVAQSMRDAIKALGSILSQIVDAHVEYSAKSDDAATTAEGETHQDVTAAHAAETDPTATTKSSSATEEALLAAINALTSKVDTLSGSLKESQDREKQHAEKAETLEKRLTAVEGAAPARKSADAEDVVRVSPIHHDGAKDAAKTAKEVSAEVRHRSSMSALGMRVDN